MGQYLWDHRVCLQIVNRFVQGWRMMKGSNVWEDSSQVDIETHRNSTWSRPCCYNLGTRIPAGLPCKNQLNRLTDFGLFFCGSQIWKTNAKMPPHHGFLPLQDLSWENQGHLMSWMSISVLTRGLSLRSLGMLTWRFWFATSVACVCLKVVDIISRNGHFRN